LRGRACGKVVVRFVVYISDVDYRGRWVEVGTV